MMLIVQERAILPLYPQPGKQTMSDESSFGDGGTDRKRHGVNIVNISGTIGNVGGDIVGGDKIVQTLNPLTIDPAFRPVDDALKAAPPEALAKLAALKSEAGKGKEADDGVVAKLLDGLVGTRA